MTQIHFVDGQGSTTNSSFGQSSLARLSFSRMPAHSPCRHSPPHSPTQLQETTVNRTSAIATTGLCLTHAASSPRTKDLSKECHLDHALREYSQINTSMSQL